MRAPQRALRLEQLDAKLGPLREVARGVPRPKSWIREIRQALGMSTYVLARRLGIRQSSVTLSEQSEARSLITLATLSRYGGALECELAYALVPRQSLSATLEQRIQGVARRMVERTAHSMDLEQQRPPEEALEHQVAALAHELRRELPRWLWDDR
jgi:predicted DNA-binding mobile mystery protein A